MTPELYLSGYPPEDLVLKPAFQEACRAACEALARETADGGPAVLVGLPWVEKGTLHNAVALLDGGRIEAVRFKVDLPNYGVFDEKRVFVPGPVAGADRVPRRAHRRPDLRGHLGAGPGRVHRSRPAARSCSCPTRRPYERDKLAVRQTSRSTGWSRAACRSSISTWSAARTRWCSRAPRSR